MANKVIPSVTNDTIEDRMLDGLELLHYSSRYAGETFVICFLCEAKIKNLFYDLRILQTSGIRSIVLVSGESPQYRQSDTALKLLYPHSLQIPKDNPELLADHLSPDLPHDHLLIHHPSADNSLLKKNAFMIAQAINSRKVILITGEENPYITVNGKPISHTDSTLLKNTLKSAQTCSPDMETLNALCESVDRYSHDTVVMNSIVGGIFSEIFTYRGFGTLLSHSHANVIRQGEESDVIDIMMIMRPDIVSNAILPMDVEEIRRDVASFYLYTVDQSIVALCRIIEYDHTCELAKFCTLPRYRGKGRAKELIQHLIREAAMRNKEFVYSLSTIDKIWELYRSLNFVEVPRETLPMSWQNNYNFSRPSKAFVYKLK